MDGSLLVEIREMRFPGMAVPLIKDFRLRIAQGEFATIVGPSGAGKTTLLRILSGLEQRYQGAVQLAGESIHRPRLNIQLVFQDYRLLPWKSALENVAFAHPNPFSKEASSGAREFLAKFGIPNRASAWPKTLSGGEQSRVSLARAMMAAPSLLLLDEPFKGLDLTSRIRLSDTLRQLLQGAGTTVVMVSHDVDDALSLSHRIILVSSSPMTPIQEFFPDPSSSRDRHTIGLSSLRRELIEHLTGERDVGQTRVAT